MVRKWRKPTVTKQVSPGDSVNSKSSIRSKRPICKATRKALIGIGKVLEYESKNKTKNKIELDISSGDGGHSDLFVPSKGSTCVASQSSTSVQFDLSLIPNLTHMVHHNHPV